MDDSQSVLATVYKLAPVGVELCLNIDIWERFAGPELSIATFADADSWRGLLYDPQFATLHDCSLTHSAGEAIALWKSNGTTTQNPQFSRDLLASKSWARPQIRII